MSSDQEESMLYRIGMLAGLAFLATLFAAATTTPATAVPWLYIPTGMLIFFVLVGSFIEWVDVDEDPTVTVIAALSLAFVFVLVCEVLSVDPSNIFKRSMDTIRSVELAFVIGFALVFTVACFRDKHEKTPEEAN